MLVDDVHVIVDAHDTPACARWFARWHDLDHGRITVRATPSATSRSLARDILRGLGKRLTLPESPAQNADPWPLVNVWLDGEQVRAVFVLRAQLLDDDALIALLAACDTARATPWLVVAAPAPPPQMMAVLERVLMNPWGEPALGARVRSFEQTVREEGAPPPRRRAQKPRAWPLLPDDEFWTFRLSSGELLSDADFERVDAQLFVGRIIALEWIEHRARQRTGARTVDVEEIYALLAGICASTNSTAQALARLRGAQAALFFAGVLVYIPADALAATSGNETAPLDRRAAALLRGFASPQLAAAGTLALATGQPARHLCALNLQSVGEDAAEISLARRASPIPYYVRGLLRAQRVAREHEGATDDDPLFRSNQDPRQRISIAALQKALVRVAAATGLALDADLAHFTLSARQWLLRGHVSIELLGTGHQR